MGRKIFVYKSVFLCYTDREAVRQRNPAADQLHSYAGVFCISEGDTGPDRMQAAACFCCAKMRILKGVLILFGTKTEDYPLRRIG